MALLLALVAGVGGIPLEKSSASVGADYRQPLRARVLDAAGNPVAGATVSFTLDSASAGACGASAPASASFAGGGTQANATTEASGIATSPALTANDVAGSFIATAAVSGSGGGGTENAGKAGGPTVAPVSFALVNLAGKPAKIAPGVGSSQVATTGAAFPIRLAVTVSDADRNPVAGVPVTFAAPATGASGRFTIRAHGSHRHRAHVSYLHTVTVRTSACGIAVAPPFTASGPPGGYIVKANAKPARAAAFALVNEAP